MSYSARSAVCGSGFLLCELGFSPHHAQQVENVISCVCMCVCVRVRVVAPFILDVSLVLDGPAQVTQDFPTFPSAVLIALIFIARRIQPSLSLVDHEVEFCVPTN